MRRRKTFVFGLMAALTACTTATTVSTTTTSTSTTTSVTSTTTTTTVQATTTTLAPTTTAHLEGNWADVPLIVTPISDVALGWWDGELWVQAGVDTLLDVSGGEDYQTVVLGSEGMTIGSEQVAACDIHPTTLPGVRLDDPQLLQAGLTSEDRTVFGVAISADWDITPREVVVDTGENASHVDVASVLLSEAGIDDASPPIKQALEVDIDGDGETEALVVAERSDLINDGSGDYSIVFAQEGSETTIVAASVIPPGDREGFPRSYRIGAVADLNRDGLMEVVLAIEEIESLSVAVYERDGAEFALRLDAGCGL